MGFKLDKELAAHGLEFAEGATLLESEDRLDEVDGGGYSKPNEQPTQVKLYQRPTQATLNQQPTQVNLNQLPTQVNGARPTASGTSPEP